MAVKRVTVIAGAIGMISALLLAGCGEVQETESQEPDGITVTVPAQGTEPAVCRAETGMELTPGSAAEGVFDDSRTLLQLRCEAEDGEKVLYLNGERQWSVPEEKTVFFWDIDCYDAFLELIAGEQVTVNGEELWQVTAYRVHPDGMEEMTLLPSGEDNSFLISGWEQLSFRGKFVQLRLPGQADSSSLYLPTPEGRLVVDDSDDKQTAISVNGRMLLLPASDVSVSSKYNVGIAFESLGSQMGTCTYNIYRSEDGGRSWFAVAEDVRYELAAYEHIYILDENTIFCCMGIGAGTCEKSFRISRDGGRSWSSVRKLPVSPLHP